MKKLTKKEFYDVYGISLLVKTNSDNSLIAELSPRLYEIAERYIEITDRAVRSELRHMKRSMYQDRKKKRVYKTRHHLSIQKVIDLFNDDFWESEYGGEAWKNIAIGLQILVNTVKKKDFMKTVGAIDYLNDLEHNNSLYLQTYSTFLLRKALDYKFRTGEDKLFKFCSEDIQRMNNRTKRKLYTYHRSTT